jgi:hypothetical protein
MKDNSEEQKPNFLGELIKGLAESFLKSQYPKTKPERKREEKTPVRVEEKKEEEAPISISNTYIIIHRERESKGFFKRLVSLFW